MFLRYSTTSGLFSILRKQALNIGSEILLFLILATPRFQNFSNREYEAFKKKFEEDKKKMEQENTKSSVPFTQSSHFPLPLTS